MLPAVLLAAVALAGSGPPRSNQTVLSVRESQRLVDWSVALRSCLVRRGIDVGPLSVTRRQIALTLADAGPHRRVVLAALACGEALGGPPASSSLQTFPGRIVLYVPKQCLIDKQVLRRGA